jgi:hypothetical protein
MNLCAPRRRARVACTVLIFSVLVGHEASCLDLRNEMRR